MIQCHLCPKECLLKNGERGNCRVRMNIGEQLETLVYGNPCSVHVDPIEKKPLFHFLPTSGTFSIATAGCNLHCQYCQNWQISQSPPEDLRNYDMPPEEVIRQALSANCRSISYTYSDPIIFYEYSFDTAQIARAHNLRNIWVTAGYINQQPLLEICPSLDAANIDLKGIRDEFYRDMCDGTLQPVLDTILTMKEQGIWIELTNLIVPTWNDSSDDLKNLSKWVVNHLGSDVPLHFSRFWPQHQLRNLPPTPENTLNFAWQIAKDQGLNYVYVGNVPGHPGNNTYCPACKNMLIERRGYAVLQNHIRNGNCVFCNEKIPGIWK